MRRSVPVLAALATLAFAGAAMAQSLTVRIDQAARVALPATARDVMIGNPAIADVSVIDGRNLVVVGKGYGATNLIVVDGRGRTILDREIVVSAVDDGRISFFRGPDVHNYACSPRCERTPMPGERTQPYDDFEKPYIGYGNRAGTAAAAGARSPGE